MKSFSTSFKGFDKDEVTSFLNEVTKQYEGMLAQLKERDQTIAALQEKLEYFTRMESTLNRALLVAEDASTQIKKLARDESQSILDNAKKNASRIVNDALMKAERVENDAETLRRKVVVFKKRLKQIYEEQIENVDIIPDDIDLNSRY